MEYIKRDLEKKIRALIEDYSCLLITGPRQVGKTTLLKKLMTEDREYVTLDDLEERKIAKNDPAMFLQLHGLPIFIDEVQYAPELFSYIKIAIDNGAPASSFWLTGSQAFKLMDRRSPPCPGRRSPEWPPPRTGRRCRRRTRSWRTGPRRSGIGGSPPA